MCLDFYVLFDFSTAEADFQSNFGAGNFSQQKLIRNQSNLPNQQTKSTMPRSRPQKERKALKIQENEFQHCNIVSLNFLLQNLDNISDVKEGQILLTKGTRTCYKIVYGDSTGVKTVFIDNKIFLKQPVPKGQDAFPYKNLKSKLSNFVKQQKVSKKAEEQQQSQQLAANQQIILEQYSDAEEDELYAPISNENDISSLPNSQGTLEPEASQPAAAPEPTHATLQQNQNSNASQFVTVPLDDYKTLVNKVAFLEKESQEMKNQLCLNNSIMTHLHNKDLQREIILNKIPKVMPWTNDMDFSDEDAKKFYQEMFCPGGVWSVTSNPNGHSSNDKPSILLSLQNYIQKMNFDENENLMTNASFFFDIKRWFFKFHFLWVSAVFSINTWEAFERAADGKATDLDEIAFHNEFKKLFTNILGRGMLQLSTRKRMPRKTSENEED